MAHTEIDSFVLKFKYLCHAGYKASLSLESENGEAFVSLKAGLGFLPPPLLLPPAQGHGHGQHLPPRNRGPAYTRRQERRRAAAKQPVEAVKAPNISRDSENDEKSEDIEITQEVIGSNIMENCEKDASEPRHLVIHLKQHLEKDCEEDFGDDIPQLDGKDLSTSENVSADEKAVFTFVSNYAEEDINDALKELTDDSLVPNLPTLVSRERIQPRSADHLCTVLLDIPGTVVNFVWSELPGYPDFFKDVKKL